jgi:hypothetical protein
MPAEGGMWTQTWRDDHGTAIYFLLQPGDFSALHRLNITELWHHYAGAPVDMLLLDPDGTVQRPVLGDDLAAGERPFLAVSSGVWMAAATRGDWSLVGTTMAPPFDPDAFELADSVDLIVQYPDAATDITRFVREEQQ